MFVIYNILVLTTVLFGFFLQIGVFKTYNGSRFGYNGILSKSINSSYYFILSIIYFYSSKEIKLHKTLLIINSFACLFVGTKALLLFLILFSFFLFFLRYNNIYYVIKKHLNKSIILLSLFFLMIYFTPKKYLIRLSSFRFVIVEDLYNNYSNWWSFHNLLFGGWNPNFIGWNKNIITELSIIDSFIFFGFLGFTMLTWFLIRFLSKSSFFFNVYFLFSFIISFFAGQFFINTTAAFYCLLAYLLMSNSSKDLEYLQKKTFL